MRLSLLFLSVLVINASLGPGLSQGTASAQRAPTNDNAPMPCTGNIDVVRLSDIKPGMMLKFIEAAALQQAWYRKAGTADHIEVKRVTERDPVTKLFKISETQAVTSHIEPARREGDPPHDAGYDAFVALYRESSTIKIEYRTCISSP